MSDRPTLYVPLDKALEIVGDDGAKRLALTQSVDTSAIHLDRARQLFRDSMDEAFRKTATPATEVKS